MSIECCDTSGSADRAHVRRLAGLKLDAVVVCVSVESDANLGAVVAKVSRGATGVFFFFFSSLFADPQMGRVWCGGHVK